MLVVKRIDRRLPAYLVGVLAAIAASVLLGLEAQGVKVVGDIPPGLPPLGLPAIGLADLQLLLVPAAAIGLLIYADSGVTGQVLGRRGGYRVDGDGEFLGLGAANIGASLTGGFPVNGSQSRSFTAADMGARSQLAGIVAVALVVVTLLFLTRPVRSRCPRPPSRASSSWSRRGCSTRRSSGGLAAVARSEAALAVLATVIVVAVGMLAGVLVIALLSLLLVAQRAARPRRNFLVRVPGTDSYRSADSTPDGLPEPGMVLYRFDGPLFFANADVFRGRRDRGRGGRRPAGAAGWCWTWRPSRTRTPRPPRCSSSCWGTSRPAASPSSSRGSRRRSPPTSTGPGIGAAADPGRVFLEVDDAVAAFRALPTSAAPDGLEGSDPT